MRLLAINTAAARLSIALVEGDVQHGITRELMLADIAEPRDQGNFLLHGIVDALKQNNLGFGDLDLMVAVTGPGSFTGIRIGLAAMRGFSLASGVALKGMTSFDLYHAVKVSTPHRLVVMESWRDELYFKLDDAPPFNVTPSFCTQMLHHEGIDHADVTLMGDAAGKLATLMPAATINDSLPNARDAALLAITQPQILGDALPFYLRDADVSFGRANRTLKPEGSSSHG